MQDSFQNHPIHTHSGVCRNCSRGGFSHKKTQNFVDLFLGRPIYFIFRALRKYYKESVLSKNFCAAGKFLKNQAKNDVLSTLTKKLRCFGARSPLKFSHIGDEGRPAKNGSHHVKVYQRGDHLEKFGNQN